MKTTFQARQPYADMFLKTAIDTPCQSPVKPERFRKIMKTHRGGVSSLTGLGLDKEGLELKNPVIVGLGDSVTAGHFENIAMGNPAAWMEQALKRANMTIEELDQEALQDPTRVTEILVQIASRIPDGEGLPPVEVVDARESYLEKFRQGLIEKYEDTSVSTINAGIAGDNLIMMEKRLTRDVIRYQPDLVLINGSLNWSDEMGTTEFYKSLLIRVVTRIQEETEADIILLTPNGMVTDEHACETLNERVQAIREVASEKKVCLADAYAVWEKSRDAGCPWVELLSNKINHPGIEGHEVYAITLMKLFE